MNNKNMENLEITLIPCRHTSTQKILNTVENIEEHECPTCHKIIMALYYENIRIDADYGLLDMAIDCLLTKIRSQFFGAILYAH